ncbi:MAG: DNRLRE domain-containing protein [Peptococcaceae bacterium]|nr:DNRLRE domain-containing protein [Peptococcaceae bacterium]
MKPVREKWDRDTRIYHLGGSQYKAVIQDGQNFYNRQTGQYEEIDLSLQRERVYEFEYAVKRNSFAAYFSDATDSVNPTLAGVELYNKNGIARWINYKILDAAPTETEAAGNKIVYRNCWPGVDCEYTVTPEKIKFSVVFASREAVREVVVTLKESPGLKAVLQDGGIVYEDKDTGETLWRIEAPFLMGGGRRRQINRNTRFRTGLTRTVKGRQYKALALTADDREWLDNAEYPVTLDPTTAIQPPGKDNFIYKGMPNTPDTLNSDILMLTNTSSTDVSRALLSFSLASLPADISVNYAELNLFWTEQWGSKGRTLYYTAYRLTQLDWLELEVCWNNRRSGVAWAAAGGDYTTANGRTISFSSPVDYPNGWIYWNLTNMVKDMVSLGQATADFLIKIGYEGTSDTGTQFYAAKDSAQTDYRPYLAITYSQVKTASFKADSRLAKRYTRSFTADAARKKSIAKPFTGNGAMRKNGIASSFTANSTSRKSTAGTFTGSAAFDKEFVRSVTAQSVFKKSPASGSAAYSVLRDTLCGGFTADCLVTKVVSTGFIAGSALRKPGILDSFKASAALRSGNTAIFFDQVFLDLQVTTKANRALAVTKSNTWEVSTVT